MLVSQLLESCRPGKSNWPLGQRTALTGLGVTTNVPTDTGVPPTLLEFEILSSFCLVGFRSRRPGPPPFSSMNSTPADSNARRIA